MVFMMIHRLDGIFVTLPRTRLSCLSKDRIPKSGQLDLVTIDRSDRRDFPHITNLHETGGAILA